MGTEVFDTKGPEIIKLDDIKEWYAQQAKAFLLSLKNQSTPLDWGNIQKSVTVGYDKKWLLAKDKYVLMVNGTEVATLKQDKNHDNIISFLYEVVKQTGIEALSGKEPAADKVKEKCNEIIINMQLDELEKGVTKATLLAEMQARLNRHTATDPRGKADDIVENEHIKDRVTTNVDIQKAQNDTLQSLIKQLNKQLKQDLETTQLQLEKEHLEHLLNELQNIQKQLEGNPSEPEIGRLRNDLQRVIGEINNLSQKKNSEIKTPRKFSEKSAGGSPEKKRWGPRADGYDDVYDGDRVDGRNITGAEVVWAGGTNNVELGKTRAPNITNNPTFEAGKDGIVRSEKLRVIPLKELIGYYNKLSNDDMALDAQQIRSALLYRMIKSGAVAPQLSTGATIEHVPFGDALNMLGNNDPKAGLASFWELMQKAMVDSSFKSKMNADVTRTLQLAQAAKAEDWRDTRQSFLYDYFELTNPQERSAIILNAFVKNLAPVLGARFDDATLQPGSLRYMFDIYKGGDWVLDYEQAAQDIERTTWELGNATATDVFMQQGAPGLMRQGLVALVEKGAITTETAAKIARGTDAVMNIAQTWLGIAGLVYGVKSAWKFVTSWFKKWDEAKKARSESWDALKKAAGFGLGGYYGMQVLKDPSSWNKIPLVGSLYALFDKDYANEQHKKDFIDNHTLRSVTTEAKILNDTIGSLTIQQLKDQGVLVKQWTNGVAINKDNFVKLVPTLEEYKTMGAWALSQFIQNLNKSLVNEYQLTWTKVEEYAATGKTLPDILKSIAETKADIKRFKDAVGSGVWDSSFDNVFESGTDAEKTALKEKLAFAAQQVNKLNNKDDVWAKYIADTMNVTDSATKAKLAWALVNAMNQTDANGVTGRAFITAKLREALVSGDSKEYFKAVAVVMSNKTTFPTQADALYMNPAIASGTAPTPDFVSFIHEPTIGNAPAGGTDYFPTPTLGAGDYADNANNYASLSAPTTKKWEEIMGEL